jgi:glycosyltransferase involved in cell wall biosynthesis
MAEPLFSVIVPTYGRPRFLREALDSVRRQTVEDFECIVVDDGSPEPVSVTDDPRYRLIRRPRNGGPAAARNTGISQARGRYLTFLDDDDVYTPERLALALDGLGRVRVSICWRGNEGDDQPVGNRTLDGDVHDVILEREVPQLGQVAVERAMVPLFDERFLAAEDTEWWLRLSSREPVNSVPRVGLLYRRHAGHRHANDRAARVEHRRMLLELNREYFDSHPRAAAYQWKKIGLMALDLGDYATARISFKRSFLHHPEARSLWHLFRSLRVSRSSQLAGAETRSLRSAEPSGHSESEGS